MNNNGTLYTKIKSNSNGIDTLKKTQKFGKNIFFFVF